MSREGKEESKERRVRRRGGEKEEGELCFAYSICTSALYSFSCGLVVSTVFVKLTQALLNQWSILLFLFVPILLTEISLVSQSIVGIFFSHSLVVESSLFIL